MTTISQLPFSLPPLLLPSFKTSHSYEYKFKHAKYLVYLILDDPDQTHHYLQFPTGHSCNCLLYNYYMQLES